MIAQLILGVFLSFGLFAKSEAAPRGFLEGLGFSEDDITNMKTCLCLTDANGDVDGVGDLESLNLATQALFIHDQEILTLLQEGKNVDGSIAPVKPLSLSNILEDMTGDLNHIILNITQGSTKKIGLPTEEFTPVAFAEKVNSKEDLDDWKLINFVFRPDLNESDRLGEGRLIFANSTGLDNGSRIILEFMLPKTSNIGDNGTSSPLKITDSEWAAMVAGLACLDTKRPGPRQRYLEILRNIISRLTYSEYEGLDCKSAIGQVRMNDFSNSRWLLFQYGLNGCDLVRQKLPFTPPDNFAIDNPFQDIRSGGQEPVSSDEPLILSIKNYLKGFGPIDFSTTSAMNTDFGFGNWMSQVLKDPAYADGVDVNTAKVKERARKFSLNTCNSCHSSCSPFQGCGGVSFFHSSPENSNLGFPGAFVMINNGEPVEFGNFVGDIVQRKNKVAILLGQSGTGDSPAEAGLCNPKIHCDYDYKNNDKKLNFDDLNHFGAVLSGDESKISAKTYDVNGDGEVDGFDYSQIQGFIKGELTASEVFINPACDTFNPKLPPTLTLCQKVLLRGDVNKDGKISIADLLLLQKILMGEVPMTSLHDINQDGKVSLEDLLLLQSFLLGHLDCKKVPAGLGVISPSEECSLLEEGNSSLNQINKTRGEGKSFILDVSQRCKTPKVFKPRKSTKVKK